MLAQCRRGEADGQAFAIDEDRRSEHPEGACRGMIQVLQDARPEEVLVREHVGQRIYGPARDAGGPDLLGPLVRSPFGELFLQLRDQGLAVGHAIRVGRVALVLGQLGTAYGLAEVCELGVVTDGHDQGLVRGMKGLVGDDGGMSVSYQAAVLAAYQVLLSPVGEPAEGRLEERNLDARTLSGLVATVEGGQYRVGCEKAAHDVRDRDSYFRGLAARLPCDAHDTPPGLHQKVVARPVLVRTGPEPRDGAVDEARVRLLQRLVAEAELLQGPAPPVLDQDVGAGRERHDPLQPPLVFQVNPDRTLVTVDGEEIRRLATFVVAGEGRPPVAGIIPTLGMFDLYDVSTKVTKYHRRIGSGQNS